MSNLLIDESPQTYKPTLAAWIGLNEAIFIQQLHYILTQNDSVGKFADGKKWYRDKPRDFMVKYFPFWDEGTVKRTIANLKEDALILARSDLNKNPKDRSLWYTVNYPALERLTGPVERITAKSAKRKEARSARKTEADSQPEYTKVQNVLIKNKGTNSTLESQQNVLLTEVQNVPTPKESTLPKDSKPKEFSPQQKMFLALAELSHIDLKVASPKQRGQIDQASQALTKTVADVDLFKTKFNIYWTKIDWRGKQGQAPTPGQVREVYGDYCHWLENGEPAQPQNGATHGTYQRSNKQTKGQLTGHDSKLRETIDFRTGERVLPDGTRIPIVNDTS